MCGCLSYTSPTGDLASNSGPDWESNQWPFRSQFSSQSTEPHQPGQVYNSMIMSSVYFIVWLLSKVKSSVTIYLTLFTLHYPPGNHHTIFHVYEFLFVCLPCLFICFQFCNSHMSEIIWFLNKLMSALFYLAWYFQDPSMILYIEYSKDSTKNY